MRVRYRVLGGETNEVETEAGTVRELMRELGLNVEEYIATRGGNVVPEDEELEEGAEIVFIPVVSGG